MKIDVSSIVRDHFSTLYNSNTHKISKSDILVFFILPVAMGAAAYIKCFDARSDAFNVSITFFGIFIALLLNIQVAIFSIFQRKWDTPQDKRSSLLQNEVLTDRRLLLKELNANISYLILVCCAALIAMLIFYLEKWESGIAPAVSVAIYAHFLFTLLMIVKRSHALFQKEYGDVPDA